jgi:toxin ParE1/3/4
LPGKAAASETADRLIDSLTERIWLLVALPSPGPPPRPRFTVSPGLRTFPVGDYVIVYRVEDDDVLVLRVLRGSRSIEGLLRE